MSDIFSKDKRSEIMRAVKSHNNKSTEIKFITILRQHKITGWRRNYKLFGKPDFTFPKYKIAVFIDGCFWHGHTCRNTNPKSNYEYWTDKIFKNKKRDKIVNKSLKLKKWSVIRIWECHLNNKNISKTINRINKLIVEHGGEKSI